MTAVGPEERARLLAAESLAAGDVTGWFERLYSAAQRGDAIVPWDHGGPHPLLVTWAAGRQVSTGRALVVGAGLGGDAEFVAALGYACTAFDVSATAVQSARERSPSSTVDYSVANLLEPPPEWRAAFDLVIESRTVQSIPRSVRAVATQNVASFVAPGGTLTVITSALDGGADPAAGPPWPLARAEVEAFAADGLTSVSIDLSADAEGPTARCWLAEFTR
ncbi:MAG: TPMT family class I SAM-dependent methyltransferase [Actinomycetota bacterium]|nr:TPMT family class I SAM-dependent methyltransferase [Actinomycetota bacterium]